MARNVPDIIEFIKSDEYLGPDDQISIPQVATLKAFYGLAMTGEERDAFLSMTDGRKPRKGGNSEMWVIAGRRSGKTEKILANIAVYEGAMFDPSILSPGETAFFPLVAQDVEGAMRARGYIEGKLQRLEARGLDFLDHGGGQQRAITGKQVRCRKEYPEDSGEYHPIVFQCFPCTKASVRGLTAIGYGTDESAFWKTDEAAYNPDVEVIRALDGTVATRGLKAKRVNVTSPYGKAGVAWDMLERARAGSTNAIVINVPSWVFNPSIDKAYLEEQRYKDLSAYLREYGAQFGVDGGAFYDPNDVDRAMRSDRPEIIQPREGVEYRAWIDAAFRKDLFAVGIGHREGEEVILDLVHWWQPRKGVPLNDKEIGVELARMFQAYRLDRVKCDSVADVPLQSDLQKYGITLDVKRMTTTENNEMHRNFRAAMKRGIVSLPRKDMIRSDILGIVTLGGKNSNNYRVAAPNRRGFHDDITKVCAAIALDLMPIGSLLDLAAMNQNSRMSDQDLDPESVDQLDDWSANIMETQL